MNLTFPPRQSFGKSGALASSLASLALAFRLNVPEIPIGQQHWYAPHTRLLALLSVALIGEIYILCGKPKTYLQFRFWIKLKRYDIAIEIYFFSFLCTTQSIPLPSQSPA